MIYFNLRPNECKKIENNYNHNVNIINTSNGYYIVAEGANYGPYKKIVKEVFSEYNDDVFLFGLTGFTTTTFRIGILGLEQTEEINNFYPATNTREKENAIKLEYLKDGHMFLGKAKTYNIMDKRNRTGFVKQRPNKLLIFKDSEHRIFAVDPSLPKISSSQCKKYDSLAELFISARNNGIDLDDPSSIGIKHNKSLTAIYVQMIKHYSEDQIQSVLNLLKSKLGESEYRNPSHDIEYKLINHSLISIPEFKQNIETLPITKDIAYEVKIRLEAHQTYSAKCAFYRMLIEKALPKQVRIHEHIFSYDGKRLYRSLQSKVSNPQQILDKFQQGEYYHWLNTGIFKQEKPEIWEELDKTLNDRFLALRRAIFRGLEPSELE